MTTRKPRFRQQILYWRIVNWRKRSIRASVSLFLRRVTTDLNLSNNAIALGLVTQAILLFAPSGSIDAQEVNRHQVAQALEQVLVQAIARAEPSVVAVARVRRDQVGVSPDFSLRAVPQIPLPQPFSLEPTDPNFVPNQYGSGVVVDRGLILTNYHVLGSDDDQLENSSFFVTTVQRKSYEAKIKAADPWSDLAVLQVPTQDLVPITFGDAQALKKGQFVVTLGNPYAIARDGQASASWGIVSNLSRKAAPVPTGSRPPGRETMHHYGTLIQVDAQLNLGASGGALLNMAGEMVGLTTSLAAATGYEKAAGYAVPIDESFRRIVESLKAGREVEYGFLGIEMGNLAREERLRGDHGVRVEQVVAATPAARDGLRAGDTITRVDERAIHDADEFVLFVGQRPVGSVVQLAIQRDGRTVNESIRLSKKFVFANRRAIVTEPFQAWRGMRVDYATAIPNFEEKTNLGEVDPKGCVAVVDVDPKSSAWRDGLRKGTFLSHVGSERVTTPAEFYSAIANQDGAVKLQVVGAKAARTIQP